ncbi:J domain-containing protein [Spirochaeta isovalerica]|uniref:Curved DNA-binding protein CbpA n=1 Tax=Spirochaeta isovalerica TaxID=150 RepID=A0A841RI01_9SPIO|nr:J domain-containing protein [Spirochaeta isovalerica]MBB6481932.1 curved DNA-binding protein CbpA [Spirochaeta isovalerica]
MTVNDCFRILELPRTAGLDDLKFAYRTMAKKYHPDRKGGDSRKFTRLHEAYELLLDYGPFKSGYALKTNYSPFRETERKEWEERKKKEEEDAAHRAAEEIRRRTADARKRREAEESRRRAAEDRKKREAERNRRRAAEERIKQAAEEARHSGHQSDPVHQARLAGEILQGKKSDREKLKAIDNLISLKRKSVYPYLKNGFYNSSDKVTAASIRAVGALQIVQAGPELSSLMCSGSTAIRRAVLDAVASFRNPRPFSSIIEMGLNDRDKNLRAQSELLRSRI